MNSVLAVSLLENSIKMLKDELMDFVRQTLNSKLLPAFGMIL